MKNTSKKQTERCAIANAKEMLSSFRVYPAPIYTLLLSAIFFGYREIALIIMSLYAVKPLAERIRETAAPLSKAIEVLLEHLFYRR